MVRAGAGMCMLAHTGACGRDTHNSREKEVGKDGELADVCLGALSWISATSRDVLSS